MSLTSDKPAPRRAASRRWRDRLLLAALLVLVGAGLAGLAGATGWAPVCTNFAPKLAMQFFDAATRARDAVLSRDLWDQLFPLCEFICAKSHIRVAHTGLEIAGRPVLGPLHLAVERGQRLAILGPSGIGKSTLLLQAAAKLAQAGRPVAYVSGEEAADQVRLRARRLGLGDAPVQLAAATSTPPPAPRRSTILMSRRRCAASRPGTGSIRRARSTPRRSPP